MLNTPFQPWPDFTDEEIDAVSRVLRSNKVNFWTGDECREFEKEFAQFVGVEHAIALANGTLALDLILKCLEIGSNDEVIVTPRTFIASVSSVVTAGANPVFADVDRNSQNITAETIKKVITSRTKAIIVVHLAGMPAEMDEIMDLAEEFDLKVVEDCAQAHGAVYKGKSVGSIGHAAAWSFCQDKIMTTGGEGGMVTTNNSDLWKSMWEYKDHGKSWDKVNEPAKAPGFRWLHDSFGTNWRMTELQAAIGRIQLQRMPDWQRARLSNSENIWKTFATFKWARVPVVPDYVTHAAYKAYVFVDNEFLPEDWSRDLILEKIVEQGIPAYTGSCSEVYLEEAFATSGFRPKNRLPVARELGENSLMFLVHPTLSEECIVKTCRAIENVDELIRKSIS